MKKNILIGLILSLGLISCEVNSFENNDVTRNDLIHFSTRTFGTYVVIPVETAEVLMAFDKYLQLSDEDKEDDTRFYGKVDQLYDDIYEINDKEEHRISFIVKTWGASLQTPGTEWILNELKLEGSDPIVENYYGLSNEFPEGIKFVTTGVNEWTMRGENFDTKMRYQGDDSGRDMWQVYTKGNVESKRQIVARFATSEEGISVKEMIRKAGELSQYRGNAYNGKFNVDIYNTKNVKLDYCYSEFTPGFTTKYITSRDNRE